MFFKTRGRDAVGASSAPSALEAQTTVSVGSGEDGACAPRPSQLSKMNLDQLKAAAEDAGICIEHTPKWTKKQLAAAVRTARASADAPMAAVAAASATTAPAAAPAAAAAGAEAARACDEREGDSDGEEEDARDRAAAITALGADFMETALVMDTSKLQKVATYGMFNDAMGAVKNDLGVIYAKGMHVKGDMMLKMGSEGVPTADRRKLGDYTASGDAFEHNYNVVNPPSALLCAAGADRKDEDKYDVPRAHEDACFNKGGKYYELLELILPGLDAKVPEVRAFNLAATSGKADITAMLNIEFLQYLRLVFLQDACEKQEEYPDHLIFTHKVFKHPLWPACKQVTGQPL